MVLFNRLIDHLLELEDLKDYMPSIIRILIVLLWIFYIRRYKKSYKASLVISLVLILISIITLIINLNSVAAIMGEYAFLFLSIGIIQLLFKKKDG